MAVSRAIRRLLRVLNLEEEQRQLALESAQAELGRLENALAAAHERGRNGRQMVVSGIRSGELQDRLAGTEEARASEHCALMLKPRILHAMVELGECREAFLAKRVERRQAETLIQEDEARDAVEADRRGQQSLDDWYLSRLPGSKTKET